LLDALDEVLTGKVSNTNIGDARYVVLDLTKSSIRITDPYGEGASDCEMETYWLFTVSAKR